MAQAHSSLARISRFGTLTAVSALGQIVGPVLGGLVIGHSEEPSLESTSSALVVAAWVFVGALPAAALAMRARIQTSTMRTGRAERVWRLLRRRGMPAALMTSFSAKSGMDLLLVYMPLLGAVVGLTSTQVGVLLGISSTGALLARATTPFFVRRIPTLKLTVVATVVAATCLLVLAVSGNLIPMMVAMSVLGFALGLSQTTTMDWVVDLVDDTSRGSALGLRVATNRVGQAFILAVAGAVSGLGGGGRGADPRRQPPLRRRVADQQHPRADLRLQRPRPAHRQRGRQRRRRPSSVRGCLSGYRRFRRSGNRLEHQLAYVRDPLCAKPTRGCRHRNGGDHHNVENSRAHSASLLPIDISSSRARACQVTLL